MGDAVPTPTPKLLSLLENKVIANEDYQYLRTTWDLFGYDEAAITKRDNTVWKYIKDLLSDMRIEEESRKDQKIAEISSVESAIINLCIDLEEHIPPVHSKTLIAKLSELEAQEAELKVKREDKMKEWKDLKSKEEVLAESIGQKAGADKYATLGNGIPSKADVAALKETVHSLDQERKSRVGTYKDLKTKVAHHMEVLEKVPTNQLELSVCSSEIPSVLSTELLAKITELESSMAKEVEKNTIEAETLRNGIDELRRRLKEEPDAQGVEVPMTNTPSSLIILRTEHARLQELKLANIGKFIGELDIEIKCLAAQVYKLVELPFKSSEEIYNDPKFSNLEDILAEYERTLEDLKTYQVFHQPAITLWKKHEKAWEEWCGLERKVHDPQLAKDRYNNRGGALLKEQKQRATLTKSVPSIENELIKLASSTGFTFFGQNVDEYFSAQREEFEREIEEYKSQKKGPGGAVGNGSVMNMTTRKRGAIGTPVPLTPGKRGKIGGSQSNLNMLGMGTPRKVGGKLTTPSSPTYSEFMQQDILHSTRNEPLKTPPSTARGGRRTPLKPKVTPFNINKHF